LRAWTLRDSQNEVHEEIIIHCHTLLLLNRTVSTERYKEYNKIDTSNNNENTNESDK